MMYPSREGIKEMEFDLLRDAYALRRCTPVNVATSLLTEEVIMRYNKRHPLEVIAWWAFTCPKCGAEKRNFCRRYLLGMPLWLRTEAGSHPERIAKAALMCDTPEEWFEKYDK